MSTQTIVTADRQDGAQGPGSEKQRTTPNLSRRERECLAFVAQGLVTKEIAQKLSISERTIDHHIGRAMKKLDVNTRTAAVIKAMSAGLLSST